MNDWMTEWMNEQMNEWMNEWMTDWLTDWMNEWINEWLNEWMNEWMNGRTIEWMSEKLRQDGYTVNVHKWNLILSDQLVDCQTAWMK